MLDPDHAVQVLNQTVGTLQVALYGITTEQAKAATFGPDARNVLSMICHLRDYERVIQQRVWLMTQVDNPTLPALHGEEVSHQQDYSREDIATALAEYAQARFETLVWLDGLSDQDWRREGAHPSFGDVTLIEVMIKVALHDAGHLQQITRALKAYVG
jgi:hypothetical protein